MLKQKCVHCTVLNVHSVLDYTVFYAYYKDHTSHIKQQTAQLMRLQHRTLQNAHYNNCFAGLEGRDF